MSSFTMTMLEDGVDVELPTDLDGIIGIFDREVPHFTCEGRGYSVALGRATLGMRWDLMVKSVNYASLQGDPIAIGRLELEKLDDHSVQLRIPPRYEQDVADAHEHDPDGRIFGAFVCLTLNTLQRHELIRLPGVLPTV